MPHAVRLGDQSGSSGSDTYSSSAAPCSFGMEALALAQSWAPSRSRHLLVGGFAKCGLQAGRSDAVSAAAVSKSSVAFSIHLLPGLYTTVAKLASQHIQLYSDGY